MICSRSARSISRIPHPYRFCPPEAPQSSSATSQRPSNGRRLGNVRRSRARSEVTRSQHAQRFATMVLCKGRGRHVTGNAPLRTP
eukprot:1138554-Rhodomonas_salina.1